jgi:hypothetical protein
VTIERAIRAKLLTTSSPHAHEVAGMVRVGMKRLDTRGTLYVVDFYRGS